MKGYMLIAGTMITSLTLVSPAYSLLTTTVTRQVGVPLESNQVLVTPLQDKTSVRSRDDFKVKAPVEKNRYVGTKLER